MRKWWIEFFLELWKCFSLRILWMLAFHYAKFHNRYLGISKKCIYYAWTEDWTLCRQIGYFLDVSGKVLSFIRFANYPYTRLNRVNASRLARFRKTQKHVNRGQTQCWALFVISKATFTKTAIKPNLDDRFSLKNFDAAVDQCTIKCIDLDNFLLWNFLWSRV